MPITSVIRLAAVATMTLALNASRNSSESSTSRYHRVEKPWNGNERLPVEWNENSTTIASGAYRNTSTRRTMQPVTGLRCWSVLM